MVSDSYLPILKKAREECLCDCINHPHDEPCYECMEVHGDDGTEQTERMR